MVAEKVLLVVDDEEPICRFLSLFFEKRGFRVLTAYSGTEALEQLKDPSISYMLLDIRLPDISGLEVLRLAKQRNPHLRVVMVTALPQHSLSDQAFALGAADYIVKPFPMDERIWAKAFFEAGA